MSVVNIIGPIELFNERCDIHCLPEFTRYNCSFFLQFTKRTLAIRFVWISTTFRKAPFRRFIVSRLLPEKICECIGGAVWKSYTGPQLSKFLLRCNSVMCISIGARHIRPPEALPDFIEITVEQLCSFA